MRKGTLVDKIKKFINEETSIGSVAGSPDSPNYGFFIGPLGKAPENVIRRRLAYPHGGKVVNDAPQGRMTEGELLNEYIYSVDGEKVTEGNLIEWFGGQIKGHKPYWGGGKFVKIEPKCLAFPYCSQGAVDKPIKLIGENKEGMCDKCYEYVSYIAKETGKTPETIAEIIRNKYLSL